MQTALLICNILATVLGALYAYRVIFGIVGLFCTKKFALAKRLHRYAIVIAARNEEAVIGNLLDSIAAQDYPEELLRVFVVADNCTDRTAEIARSHAAFCYERHDTKRCTKGYALEFLFRCIERDFGIESFDGYFIFDADNLLKSDYVSRMNDAFDSGERVVVSYRNTKNLGDGWLSSTYALHWLRTCRLEHCARSALGISCRIQGTGVLFSNEFVRDGWHYTSLTEDRAFSSVVVTKGVTISYQHEAQFWDEQPNSLYIACRQRLRWAKGNLQAFVETGGALLKGIFSQKGFTKRASCYDMLLFNFPSSVVSLPLKLIEATLIVISCVMAGKFGAEWFSLLVQVVEILLFEHLTCVALGALVFFLERRRMPRLRLYQYVFYSLTFPIFGLIGDVVMLLAVFKKVTWQPIPHNASVRLEQLEPQRSADSEKKTSLAAFDQYKK